MKKPQSKISEADKNHESEALAIALKGSAADQKKAVEQIAENFTPAVRTDILTALALLQDLASVSEKALKVFYEGLTPSKKAKNNGEYMGAIFFAMSQLAKGEGDAEQYVASELGELVLKVVSNPDGVVSTEHLPVISTNFYREKKYLVGAVKISLGNNESDLAVSTAWARMLAPLLGVGSRENELDADTAAQLVEVFLGAEKSRLADELLLILPRIASLGGAHSMQLLSASEHAAWMSSTEAATAGQLNFAETNEVDDKEEQALNLSTAQAALLRQLSEEFRANHERITALAAEAEIERQRSLSSEGLNIELEKKVASLELIIERIEQKFAAASDVFKGRIDELEQALVAAEKTERTLQKELNTVSHQSNTLTEISAQRLEDELEQVFIKPLVKLKNLVTSAVDRHPDINQLAAISAQLDNCIRKANRYQDSAAK